MKIAFISDIHGSAYAVRTALNAALQWGADRIAVLGDVMYHGPRNPFPKEYDPKAVAEILNENRERIVAVRGNCDSEVDQMLIEYPMMGDYAWITLPERSFFLTHGHVFSLRTIRRCLPVRCWLSGIYILRWRKRTAMFITSILVRLHFPKILTSLLGDGIPAGCWK